MRQMGSIIDRVIGVPFGAGGSVRSVNSGGENGVTEVEAGRSISESYLFHSLSRG